MNQVQMYMCINFVSSIVIIWANKHIFVHKYMTGTQLTILHFVVTFFALAVKNKNLPKADISLKSAIPISIAFCGFVVFNNLSLQHNRLGTYQLLKVVTTPCIVAIQYGVYGVEVSRGKALALICVGVAIATSASLEGVDGLAWGVCGVLATSVYQIWVKTEQQRLKCSSEQLLMYQAPLGALFLSLIEFTSHSSVVLGYEQYVWIMVSSVCAIFVNVSIFYIIGKTSPITYNVLGHCKLCVILLSGYLLFNEAWNFQNIFGIAMALSGIIMYY